MLPRFLMVRFRVPEGAASLVMTERHEMRLPMFVGKLCLEAL